MKRCRSLFVEYPAALFNAPEFRQLAVAVDVRRAGAVLKNRRSVRLRLPKVMPEQIDAVPVQIGVFRLEPVLVAEVQAEALISGGPGGLTSYLANKEALLDRGMLQ